MVHQILALLSTVEPGGSPELAPLFKTVDRQNRRARIAIVSDFLGDAEELLKIATQRSAAGREVHAVHVIHSNEMSPSSRPALVIDPEAADLKRPMSELSRIGYLDNFGAWRRRLAREWRMAGAYYTEVVTDRKAAYAVRRIVLPPETGSRG